MNKNDLEQLIRVYNTLTEISTKGEDTILMANCLQAFRATLNKLQTEQAKEQVQSDNKEE